MKHLVIGGLSPLVLSLQIAALFFGIALWVQTRAQKRADEPAVAVEHIRA